MKSQRMFDTLVLHWGTETDQEHLLLHGGSTDIACAAEGDMDIGQLEKDEA